MIETFSQTKQNVLSTEKSKGQVCWFDSALVEKISCLSNLSEKFL